MTGLEIIRAPGTTAEQIADIIAEHCPPVTPEHCDKLSCRECWLAWLATGEPPKEKGPSDKQTAPDEEGLHPNLAEQIRKQQIQEHKKQTLVNMAVSAVYEAIALEKDGEVTSEQRWDLLVGLLRTYRERGMDRKLGIAHQAALDRIGGLFSFEDSE